MLPTITDLTSTTAISSKDKKALADAFNDLIRTIDEAGQQDGVKVVRRGSNDDNEVAFQATMNRIMSKHNYNKPKGFDSRKREDNDNVSRKRAIEKTLDNIVSKFSHTEAEGWLKYSKANGNETTPWQDGIITEPVSHTSSYENTIDRILSIHNSHDDREWVGANDNRSNSDIAESYMDNMRKRYLRSTGSRDAANDNSKPVAKRAKSDNALLKEIAKNTSETSKNVEKLAELFDDLGIDSLRAREKDLESGHDIIAGTSDGYSSMDPDGEISQNKGLLDRLLDTGKNIAGFGVGAAGLAAAAVGKYLGGDSQQAIPGGGNNGDGQIKATESWDGNIDGTPFKTAREKNRNRDKRGGGASIESTGAGYVRATEIPAAVRNDIAFQNEVTRLAKKYNLAEDDMYRVMSFETGGTFSPSKKNAAGSGATGLIQFMPGTARGLGTTTSRLADMSRAQQMEYVEKYFDGTKLGKLKNPTVEDLYMSIYKPKAVGRGGDYVHARIGSKEYSQNNGFDVNNDGVFNTSEATSVVKNHNMPGIGKYKAPTAGNSEGPGVIARAVSSASALLEQIAGNTSAVTQEIKKQGSHNKGARTNAASVQDAVNKPAASNSNVNVNAPTVNNVSNKNTKAPRTPVAAQKGFWDMFMEYFD
jgi:hypothetical protein